ncbi:OLC1v1008459C1 [Oldenlandia corymbosa var. corymbosa]|nr:OLC1v1008459C1 [Oldenlandia corymbosa var. corymbosa]
MLATLLASTPLVEESWKLCSQANREAQQSYIIKQFGGVCYVAFSGVQNLAGFDPNCSFLVPIHSNGLFSGLHQEQVEEDDDHVQGKAAMVHAGLLHLFLSFYNNPSFQSQIMEITSKSKSVVFSGHSVGGTIASLAALWLLSSLHLISSSLAVICITFGSPMLGNESLSKAILQERWGGNFLHVVGQHDIVPRLLFTPLPRLNPHLHHFFDFWQFSMASQFFKQHSVQFCDERAAADLFHVVLNSLEEQTRGIQNSPFWPFGSYIFCTGKGSISVDNAVSVVKLLYMMLGKSSPSSTIDDHLNYENYVSRISWQILSSNDFMEGDLPESSYEAGITLALQSSDIAPCEPVFGAAKDCLKMAKQMGRTPSLNCANLAIGLSKITPLRAQIEWYKATCDASDDQMGYYDSFKQRGASKKEFKVNMNRHKLARFWNDVISMLESNQLPHDFHKRLKWVNASHFYKLLVEPLDIAEYYKSGEHLRKGHYMSHGRPKRYKIFDKWWNDAEASANPGNSRSSFASLTQDSCFWARVEEARDCLNRVQREGDVRIQSLLLENINKFDQYAREMVDRKEVSIDVLAKNSSYKLFVEEWKKLKFQLQILPSHFPSFPDGEGSSSRAYIVGK